VWSIEVHRWRIKLGVWVTVVSANDISGLRRPKNVKFGTKVASSTRIVRALRLLDKFLIAAKVAKNRAKMCFIKTPAQAAYMSRHHVSGFSASHLRQCGALRTL